MFEIKLRLAILLDEDIQLIRNEHFKLAPIVAITPHPEVEK